MAEQLHLGALGVADAASGTVLFYAKPGCRSAPRSSTWAAPDFHQGSGQDARPSAADNRFPYTYKCLGVVAVTSVTLPVDTGVSLCLDAH